MAVTGVGIIGLGMAIKPHVLALRELGGVARLVAGFSPTAARREAFTRDYDAPAVASLDGMLSRDDIQAVLIATPPRTHGELARAAARAGKHVLLEKPLDIDYPSALALVDDVERAGRTFGVVFQHRFREGAMALRAALAEHALGELKSISASIRWWRSYEYFAEPGRGSLARDAGGVLLTQAIHSLDLMLDLVGPIRNLTAKVRNSGMRRIDTEDIACAVVEYANGAVGVVDATTTAYPGYPERIEIAGTKGSALLEGERLVLNRYGEPVVTVEGSTSGGGGADPMAFSHASHRRLIADFVAAVQAGRQPLANARSALKVHALIDGVLESARRHATVELPA